MQLKPLGEQVVVVMGASSGIGRLAALRFAERGAKVVVSARSESGLESLVEDVRGAGGEATALTADVADFDRVKAVAERAVDEYGRLDTWAHLAAINLFARFEDTEPEEFRRVVEIDLMGQVHGAMAALPLLKQEGRGALVHVSSMAARRSIPLQSAYSAAKHGIDGFLESLRVELMHEGLPISVTNVMPATIDTPLFDKSRTKLGVKPVAPPPIYESGIVVDAILHAAEHPERDLIVGGAARAILTSQQVSPQLVDTFFERFGIEVQHTDQPKSPDEPNNLFEHVEGYDTVEGSFSDQAIPGTFANLLELNPAARLAADTSTALGILATLQANGTILELLAEQSEEQRQVLQKLARESINAYTELLDTWTFSLSGRDQQQLFQRTARQWVGQTRKQQQTFQQLAQEYVNAYMEFLNAPFSSRTETREPPEA